MRDQGMHHHPTLLADAFEALLGAIYLDQACLTGSACLPAACLPARPPACLVAWIDW